MRIETKINVNDYFYVIYNNRLSEFQCLQIKTNTNINSYYVPETEIVYTGIYRNEKKDFYEKDVFSSVNAFIDYTKELEIKDKLK